MKIIVKNPSSPGFFTVIFFGQVLKSLLLTMVFVLLSAPLLWAVDGIAVSRMVKEHEWPPSRWGGDIHRYKIVNDDVVEDKVIFSGFGRCASLNISATQVAFFRAADSGDYISLVAVNGGAVSDLYKIPNQDGYNHKGYMDWPVGDWIYFNMGQKSEGSKHLMRVNWINKKVESVLTFKSAIWQWQMSQDGKRMVIVVDDNGNYGVETYVLPGNGTINGSSSCGAGISPSGDYITFLTDPNHLHISIQNFGRSESWGMNHSKINAGTVNAPELRVQCPSFGGEIRSSGGMDQNRWSSNSDNWICIATGWPQIGRFGGCSMNQVLVNWKEEKSVMVSKNPRSCDNKDNVAACKEHTPDHFRLSESGDFIVSAPISDILPALRSTSLQGERVRRGETNLSPQIQIKHSSIFQISEIAYPTFKASSGTQLQINGKQILIKGLKDQ